MITSHLFFGVDLKFDITINEQLRNLSALRVWDKGLQKYVNLFPLSNLNKVLALVGDEINFEHDKEDIANLLNHMPSLTKEVDIGQWKGEGMLHIEKFPRLFIIKTVMRKKPVTKRLPLETVAAAWRGLKLVPMNKGYKSKELAENFVKELNVTRFNRGETGTFDGDKLYGTRNIYFMWYYSLKVLESEGLIKYEKDGTVTRIKERWEYQSKVI